jgi:hypothetical protein
MAGAPSQLELFDYKPGLIKIEGQPLPPSLLENQRYAFIRKDAAVMAPQFRFAKHGKCGTEISDALPYLSKIVDDITLVRSVKTDQFNHAPAQLFFNTGSGLPGRPSMGSWLSYGLGSENKNLPGFMVFSTGAGISGGAANWSSGFLPATYQGVPLQTGGKGPLVDNLEVPGGIDAASRKGGLGLLETLNTSYAAERPLDDTLRARIRSYEMAGRLQTAIPHVADLSGESKAVRSLYGLDDPKVEPFARNCLLARRMLERGVRFVQMFHGGAFGSPRINWDGHEDLRENHTTQSAVIDRPFSALLADLKARGMWEDTLILWTTEFGRTPITQGLGASGRDHHPFAFTIWMAGAGLKPGHHGVTDELGFAPVDGRTTIYDFHATVLHLLGLDHTRLSYYSNGVKRRLTDVHGEVIDPILA